MSSILVRGWGSDPFINDLNLEEREHCELLELIGVYGEAFTQTFVWQEVNGRPMIVVVVGFD